MHWMVILTALTLALSSSFLVIVKGWELWQACLAIGCLASGIIFILLALLSLLSNENRETVWRSFRVTFRRDLNDLLETLGIKKRM